MFFSLFSHTIRSVSMLCVLVFVCGCMASVKLCVFQSWLQQRGATLAPPEHSTRLTLLGLQVKAEYICLSVPHPAHFALIFIVHSVSFSPFLAPRICSCFYRLFLFLSISLRVLFINVPFFNILFRNIEPCSGIACFRPLTTILSVLPMPILSLFSSAPCLQWHQHLLLCCLWIILCPLSGTCKIA